MGDAILVTSSPRLPVFRMLTIVSDLPPLPRRQQGVARHRGSRIHVLCEH